MTGRTLNKSGCVRSRSNFSASSFSSAPLFLSISKLRMSAFRRARLLPADRSASRLVTISFARNEREAVAKLVLLVVREIVKLAENDRLEHRHRVPGLSPRRRLPFLGRLAPDRLQAGTEILPRNHRVDPRQRIVLGVQAGIPIRCRKSPFGPVPHIYAPNRPDYNRQGSEQGFLEVPMCSDAASGFPLQGAYPFPGILRQIPASSRPTLWSRHTSLTT